MGTYIEFDVNVQFSGPREIACVFFPLLYTVSHHIAYTDHYPSLSKETKEDGFCTAAKFCKSNCLPATQNFTVSIV